MVMEATANPREEGEGRSVGVLEVARTTEQAREKDSASVTKKPCRRDLNRVPTGSLAGGPETLSARPAAAISVEDLKARESRRQALLECADVVPAGRAEPEI